ncbi:MAG: hypothetical protein NXI28_12430 [bacterium]|nr:hypothetical protein [bacterium]
MDDAAAREAAFLWHPEWLDVDQKGVLGDEQERHLLIHAVAESLLYGDHRLASIAKTAEESGIDGHEVRHCLARAFTTGLWRHHKGEGHDEENMAHCFLNELKQLSGSHSSLEFSPKGFE